MSTHPLAFLAAYGDDGYWFGGYGVKRHQNPKKPRLWTIQLCSDGYEIVKFFAPEKHSITCFAVMDDFGNLVRVQP